MCIALQGFKGRPTHLELPGERLDRGRDRPGVPDPRAAGGVDALGETPAVFWLPAIGSARVSDAHGAIGRVDTSLVLLCRMDQGPEELSRRSVMAGAARSKRGE